MQVWHRDVDPVHRHTQKGETLHAPPQGLVVVVPLVDMTALNGPTQFVAGSHVNVQAFQVQNQNEQGAGGGPTPLLTIPARRGDAVLFDLRIRHRGTPNLSKLVRPIVYMSYVHAWFRDEVNFKGLQSNSWASEFEDTASRKLFMRADQQRYVAELETKLSEAGVDVGAMRTSLSYKAAEMRV
jgi:ectoine hydroxylase-related dioxygenase (phytanoyl-CoA dioxygenase family)